MAAEIEVSAWAVTEWTRGETTMRSYYTVRVDGRAVPGEYGSEALARAAGGAETIPLYVGLWGAGTMPGDGWFATREGSHELLAEGCRSRAEAEAQARSRLRAQAVAAAAAREALGGGRRGS